MVVAGSTLGLQYAGIYPDSWKFSVALLAVNVVLMALILGVVDRGRLISPAYSRLDKRNLDKLRRVRYPPSHRPKNASSISASSTARVNRCAIFSADSTDCRAPPLP
jgi:hypothetical protein